MKKGIMEYSLFESTLHVLFILFIYCFIMFLPKIVFASNSWNGTASVGRSAVLDTSNNYYYTDWKLLSSNSLNIIPVPYSGGQYYHMGAEYSFPFTAMGDTTYVAQFRVPVVSNTIYNYTLMNGLNQSDVKVGIDKDFSVYNVNWSVDNINWECSTYPSLGVAHNYCYYDVKVHFTITDPLYGAYNLNFAVLNTTASRSSYYYDGYDSQGCAIEFPNAASGSGYPLMSPSVILNGYSSGGGGNTDTDEITDSIDSASQDIQDAIQESYENLVKSQEVCSPITIDKNNVIETNSLLYNDGTVMYTPIQDLGVTDFIYISDESTITVLSNNTSYTNRFCFYDENKTFISCLASSTFTVGNNLTIPNNSNYIRATILISTNSPSFSIYRCQNGNQALYDGIMDHDTSGIDFTFGDIDVISDTPVSDLLLLPLELITKITTSLGSGCQSWSLPFNLWGNGNYNLLLPCLNLETYLGSNLWGVIDDLFCILMLYNIFRMLLRFYESWTSLNDTFDDVVGGVK